MGAHRRHGGPLPVLVRDRATAGVAGPDRGRHLRPAAAPDATCARARFFANLGDFAGPGTDERHQPLPRARRRARSIPNVCLIGNHDLEDPRATEAWSRIHGPTELRVRLRRHALRRHRRRVGAGRASSATRHRATRPAPAAKRCVSWTRRSPQRASTNRVVLLHAPPHLDGHYGPQPECGFRQGEPEFLDIIRRTASSWSAAPTARLRPSRPRRHPLRDDGRRRRRAVPQLPQRRPRPRRALPCGRDHARHAAVPAAYSRLRAAGSAPPFTFGDYGRPALFRLASQVAQASAVCGAIRADASSYHSHQRLPPHQLLPRYAG